MPLLAYYSKDFGKVEEPNLVPPPELHGMDILRDIYAPDPVTNLPGNDLRLLNTPLPDEVATVLGQIHRSISSREVYSSDKAALNSVIPRSFQDRDVLQAYFKNIGLDSEVIDRTLDGDNINNILNDSLKNKDE